MLAPGASRDWRSAVVGRPVRARGPAPDSRRAWPVAGEVTSETEAAWLQHAGGTRALSGLAWTVTVLVFLATGGLGRLAALGLAVLAPFLPLVVVVLLVLLLVPARILRLAAGLVVVLRLMSPRGGRRPSPSVRPGRQLTLAVAGRTEEVLVAASHRFPVGGRIRVWGPRAGGRYHAWVVRRPGGVLVARGVVPAAVALGVCAVTSAALLLGAVQR